jgi:thiamine biosynthesis protein ThiS
MHVQINGESRPVPPALSVADLLTHLRLDARMVAVELNRAVIKRALYGSTPVADGDEIEIVAFVGGG